MGQESRCRGGGSPPAFRGRGSEASSEPKSSWPLIEPFHGVIRGLVGTVTIATVHQRLRDEHGLSVSLSSLRRYVAANLPAEAAAAVVTMLGEDPPLGKEGQVDYGLLGMWYDPLRGARRRVWAFVLVLAAAGTCSSGRSW